MKNLKIIFIQILVLILLLSSSQESKCTTTPTKNINKQKNNITTKKTYSKSKKTTKENFSVFNELRFSDFSLLPSLESKQKLKEYTLNLKEKYESTPDVFSIAIEYGLALIDSGDLDNAEKVFDKAVKDFYANDTPKAYRGWVYARKGNYIEAKKLWMPIAKTQYDLVKSKQSYIFWQPPQIASIVGLNFIYNKLPETDRADIKELIDELPKHLNHPHLVALQVEKDLKEKNLKASAEKIAKSLSVYSEDSLAITLLGITQLIIGDNQKALKLFDNANEIYPYSPTNHLMKAKALNALGKRERAIVELDETIKLDPTWEEPKKEKQKLLITYKKI